MTTGGKRWLAVLAVLVATAAVYIQTLDYEFVYDDYGQIVETSQFNSWHIVPRYFTGHVWSWKRASIPTPYYRPLFLIGLLVQQKLFEQTASWWHLTSALLHVLVTLLVYFLARRLTDDWLIGVLAAAVFGLHPVHIEAVAWVSAVNEPMTAAAVVGSFLCYLRRGTAWQLASLALFAAALLAKENALALLPLLCWYEWLKGPGKRSLRSTLPHLGITLLYLGIRYKAMGYFTLVVTPMSWRNMVLTWPEILLHYAKQLVWPVGLSAFSNLTLVTSPNFREVVLPCVTLAAIAAALWWWSRKWRVAAFCAMWMLLPILPVLNLRLFARTELAHDRYLYLPSIGFAILAAAAMRRIQPRAVQASVAGIVLAALAVATVRQSGQWANNVALFERGIAMAPRNEVAWQGMGTSLMLRGLPAEAVPYYQKALDLQPAMYESNYSLGRAYYELGSFAEAEPYLNRAAGLAPFEPPPYLYFGLAEMRLGRLDRAEIAIRRAIQLKGPDDFREYHLSLGLVLAAKGDSKGAMQEFEREARENPDPHKALEQIELLRR